MPYTVPDGGIVQVTFEGRVLSQQMLSVLHYVVVMAGGVPDGALALDAIRTQLFAAGKLHEKYLLAVSDMYVEARLRLQWILPTRMAYKEYIPANTNGQVGAEIFAPNASAAIIKRSDQAGVHGHGVLHMPAVPTSHITEGALNAAGLLAYADVGTELKAPLVTLGSGTYNPIIFNRALPGEIVEITNFTVDNRVRTMHRRTVGVGA